MQPINAIVNELRDTLTPVDYTETELIEKYLLQLPSTESFQLRITNAIQQRDAAPEDSRAREAAEEELARCAADEPRYAARDRLAVGRPEGCFCLGLGGRRPRFTQAETKVYSELCDCPDGARIKETQERLLAEERSQREAERIRRLFGKAQVPVRFSGCTLYNFPISEAIRPALAEIKSWLTSPDSEADNAIWDAWIAKNKESLLLHGPYGVGKTGLAVGILRYKIPEVGGGLFFTVPTLLDHIRRTYGPNPVADEHEIIQTVKNTPFLVLDDLGAERVTEWVREKLFTIINHRHDENLPTVFTSNLDIAELGQHIGERTTWRIVEMATVIHVDGPNLRASVSRRQ